ncbi:MULTISPECIES: iron-containing alcohol dehydrogenase [Bacillus cereus group]|uniref:iron-containing alcohol dehydrogenase n=1 Tax=Bacillus cereus group TaxID=86661 RepID=UPI0003030C42|nr:MULTISPECIES: iron-containing alcohol dehydrogenase [Bacillus cereus group]MBJ7949936.1 iron-containing alcohol dehydrogenase [Bacillus cereus group sp. N24]PEB28476.1 butanol dehydrogenase [Bacillus toyonensis]
MNRFTIPRDIYYGEGSLEVLKTIQGKRATIVIGGQSIKKSGYLNKIESYLREAGFATQLIEGVEPDPSVTTVQNGANMMEDFQPDWIIAVGGGSPIDAAKVMWTFYEHPELTFEEIKAPTPVPTLRNKARFIAISTTSGTGTDVSPFSIITDREKGVKYPVFGFDITPDIAIVDPELTYSMPPQIVAYTGMDVLTHGIEAYVSTLHTPFTDPLAMQSIKMTVENIEKSFAGDKKARGEMHYAQCIAGMAFSNAFLGIVHSLAHKSGAIFNIPHGCANAIYLPYVIDFNKKVDGSRYADIARMLGLTGSTEDELIDSLTDLIRRLNKALGLPLTLKEFGVTESELEKYVDQMAAEAIHDPCTSSNPREVSVEQMKQLYIAAFKGQKVNF